MSEKVAHGLSQQVRHHSWRLMSTAAVNRGKPRKVNPRIARGRDQAPDRMPELHRQYGLAVLVVLVLVLVSCAQSAVPQHEPSTTREASGDLQLPGDFLITFYQEKETPGGKEPAFSSLFTQGKPVVLNFWAGLCPPCRAEMPDFQSVYGEYRDRAVIFGLDVGSSTGLGSRDDGQALLQELNITYPTGTTSNGRVVSSYRVLGMPTTVFMTPDGGIHRSWTGRLTEQKLVDLMEELLAASA